VTTLHELNLARNQISNIPETISNLTNLRLLYIGVFLLAMVAEEEEEEKEERKGGEPHVFFLLIR